MTVLSRAQRVRREFVRIGLLAGIFAFVFVGGDVLFEQWIEGHATLSFIAGTTCLVAATSILLFAFITGVGLLVSQVLSDDPPQVQ